MIKYLVKVSSDLTFNQIIFFKLHVDIPSWWCNYQNEETAKTKLEQQHRLLVNWVPSLRFFVAFRGCCSWYATTHL